MKNKIVAYLKLGFMILLVCGLSIFIYKYGSSTLFNPEWLESLPNRLSEYKRFAFVILILVQFVQIVICFLPGEPIQIAASYLYGVIPGYLMSVVGAIIGAIAAFGIARLLGRDAMHYIFTEEKVESYRKLINSGKGMTLVLLIYLIPGIPKDAVAYIAGVSEMRMTPFIILSTIGRSPGMIGSLLMGKFIETGNYAALAILFTIACLTALVCIVKRKALFAFLERFSGGFKGENNG